MNYRSTYSFKPPFRVTCTVDDDPNSALKVSHMFLGFRGCIVCWLSGEVAVVLLHGQQCWCPV